MRFPHGLLALLVSLASIMPAWAELSQQPAFTIGAWTGMRYVDARGAVVSCAVMTSAGTRDGIAINLGSGGGVAISVSREGWKFGKGSADAEFIIDGVTVATRAEAPEAGVLRVTFGDPDDRAVYDRLGTGSLLEIRTGKGNQTYDLTGLDRAMPALYDCAFGQTSAAPGPSAPSASAATGETLPATPFDVPGATRLDKSEVMAVMANTMSDNNDPKPTFLLARELARVLPGYDVGWRDDTGVLVGTAVRGQVGSSGVSVIIGNLLGAEASRCPGKMTIEIAQSLSTDGNSRYIDAYCDGGGNGKQAHFLIYAFDKGGTMITRFEPISMKEPGTLRAEIHDR